MPGSTAALRCGRRPRSTPSSGSSTSPRATPRPTSTAAARGRQPLRRLDRRARREDRRVPLALPAGAPRHLGLRRARARSCSSTFGRRARKAIAQAGKTGWLYLLDRETGKPLLADRGAAGAPERGQKTAPTQPIPATRRSSRRRSRTRACRSTSSSRPKGRRGPGDRGASRSTRRSATRGPVIAPGPQGGTNWQPIELQPGDEMFYVCAQLPSPATRRRDRDPRATRGRSPTSEASSRPGSATNIGYFTADRRHDGESRGRSAARSRATRARRRRRATSSSSAATTASSRRTTPRTATPLELPDRRGREHHRDRLRAGRDAVRGLLRRRQRAGGDAHGDNLWLFSLDGTLLEGRASGPGGAAAAHKGTPQQSRFHHPPASGPEPGR